MACLGAAPASSCDTLLSWYGLALAGSLWCRGVVNWGTTARVGRGVESFRRPAAIITQPLPAISWRAAPSQDESPRSSHRFGPRGGLPAPSNRGRGGPQRGSTRRLGLPPLPRPALPFDASWRPPLGLATGRLTPTPSPRPPAAQPHGPVTNPPPPFVGPGAAIAIRPPARCPPGKIQKRRSSAKNIILGDER